MSRNVPPDQPLTDDDRRYLRMLGAHGGNMEARIDEAYPPDPDKLAAFDASERKAAAAINGQGLNAADQNSLMAENERLRQQLAELTAVETPAVSPPEEKVPAYSSWRKADLEAEVDRVNNEDATANLSKGTVAEMADALTAYFNE